MKITRKNHKTMSIEELAAKAYKLAGVETETTKETLEDIAKNLK